MLQDHPREPIVIKRDAFAAIVSMTDGRGEWINYYACQESQKIDFKPWWARQTIKVKQAVFGALKGGDRIEPLAMDVVGPLQWQININAGVVQITAANLGDPAPGVLKHFAAIVERNGKNYYYACQEGQTIDFTKGV
jgi:hypothetical protein